MERRGFLKGLFGGVTAAGLIVAAGPKEIAAFASPLVKDAPVMLDVPTPKPAFVGFGEHLYNSVGELVAIVSGIDVSMDKVETTMFGDYNSKFVAGRTRISIHAEGVCSFEWPQQPGDFPRLRGSKGR